MFWTDPNAISPSERRRPLAGKRGRLGRLLLSGVAGCALAAPALAQQSADKDAIETITVTASRRSETLHDVPISIQAITGDTLQKLNVENFDDLIKFAPAVSQAGFGPGQMNIFLRGLSVGGPSGDQSSGAVGSFPNVAVYLDEQSAQVPGRNLDLYSVDLQRVEILEGPQGVTFGSGAQAGVVRYITNKPDLDNFTGTINAGFAGTDHGDMSKNGDVTVNVPIIEGQLAARLVVYDDSRGGYINNVPGTFARQSTDIGIQRYGHYTNNIPGPSTAINTANNANLVGDAINPVNYRGLRGELAWKFNDDWDVLVQQSFQDMRADGVFYETPQNPGDISNLPGAKSQTLPPLSVQLYNPSSDKDDFENTALTINGRIGDLKLTYTGAYLERQVNQVQDYTAYARGVFADYYQCLPANATGTGKPQCYSPSATWHDQERDTHQSHELRVSTPDDWQIRVLGGVYWEQFKDKELTDWTYATAPGFGPIGPPAGATLPYSANFANNVAFANDIERGYEQKAAYTSIDYDILPKSSPYGGLTVSAGTRFYRFDNREEGAEIYGFYCGAGPYTLGGPYSSAHPCLSPLTKNLDALNLKSEYHGFDSRANLTWYIDPDAMVYYTWSQGFRPGGFNRGITSNSKYDYASPISFAPDQLTNNEIGYKTDWLSRHLEWDGALYHEHWAAVQDRLFDPALFGNTAFTVNGPDYRVWGTETSVTWRVTPDLTVFGGGEWNYSSQLTSPLLSNKAGQLLGTGVANATPGADNPFGAVGSTLAQSPKFKGNLRVRYEFEYGDFYPFAQVGVSYVGAEHSGTGVDGSNDNYGEDPYTTVDMSFGVSQDNWSAQVYVNNLTNNQGATFISDAQFVKAVVVTRPLTAGLKLSYSFK